MIERTLTNGAWVYTDPAVHDAAQDWTFVYGFNLTAFDNYLEEPGWDTPKARTARELLLRRRAQALDAHRTGNHEAAVAWINYLQEALRAGHHRAALLPEARLGSKIRQANAQRRKDKPTSDRYDADRNTHIRAFHARLVVAGHHDPTSQTATEFGLSTRTIRRILQG